MALIMHTLFLNLAGQTALLAYSVDVTTSPLKSEVPLREASAKQALGQDILSYFVHTQNYLYIEGNPKILLNKDRRHQSNSKP